jgi:formylglycine-generating enzyme required for sulfatase activity
MRFVLIPPGKFMMGSPDNEPGRAADQGPMHEVEISKPFHLAVFQVTREEYQQVMGVNPSRFAASMELDTRRFPVESVSYKDAVDFCQRLSALPAEKESGRAYRLPTEAEWEYSCRGGAPSKTFYPFGNSITDREANFNSDLARTSLIGSYPANAFGLHDMIGNVREWCADWYDAYYYQQSPKLDPQGPSSGDRRVLRGGAWGDSAVVCRSTSRFHSGAAARFSNFGFRVVLVPV